MKRLHLFSEIKKSSFFVILFFLLSYKSNCQATQYKENTEVGFSAGASYYLGDLNKTHFYQSLPSAGFIIRRNIDRRFSYRAEAMFINIRSDERNSKDTIAQNRGLHFSNNIFEENGSPIYELSGELEFNFLPYETGNPLYTWTPFIYTGVSFFHFNPKAENNYGEWIALQPLGTEGQGTTTFPNRKKYSLIQFAIPMGGGFKIAINKSFNIIIDYSIRKTFTDYLDDVSTSFVGGSADPFPIEMGLDAQIMSDPNGTHLKGEQRGDPNKKDWYSFIGITLSFKLNNNTIGCDY